MHEQAYERAYVKGFSVTRRFLMSRGGMSLNQAEEIAQAAWVQAWERREQLRNPAMLTSWVVAIARNIHRASFRGRVMVELDTETAPTYELDTDPIDLRGILSRCKPVERTILLRILNGDTMLDIARDLGITETGARVKVMRARRAARSREGQVWASA